MDVTTASSALAGAVSAATDQESDARLVARAASDATAFEVLYLRHQRAIWRYLRHRTGESHAADDLAAEVFFDFLRSLPGFRWRGVGVRGWLYRVASRKAARWSRRKGASTGVDEEACAARDEVHASDETCRRVRAALDLMPLRFQTVLVLHHLEGIPIDELAQLLEVRAGTVKSRLARGRAELKRRLIQFGAER